MKVYICGKVTGEPERDCKFKFMLRARYLRDCGHEVVVPTEIVPFDADWKEAMRICIAALVTCEAISPLSDTLNSKGAMLEWQIAQPLGLKVIIPSALN